MTNENIKAGAEIHAGDFGYSIGTQEDYEAFVKVRNKSLAEARLKELFEYAFPPSLNDSALVKLSADKFAELLVNECINVIQKDLDENPQEHDAFQQAMYHATLLLKEKFGVEQ